MFGAFTVVSSMKKILSSFSIVFLTGLVLIACGSNNGSCPTGSDLMNGTCISSLGSNGATHTNTNAANAASNGQSADATQYWNEYRQCGANMVMGNQTCTCINGLVFSIHYNQCVYPTQTGSGSGVSTTHTYCYNGYYYVNNQLVCR